MAIRDNGSVAVAPVAPLFQRYIFYYTTFNY